MDSDSEIKAKIKEFRKISSTGLAKIKITKHALKRLKERILKEEYIKMDDSMLKDIIKNIVRDGKYRIFKCGLIIWTRRYYLICEVENDIIVVKTVISKRSLKEELLNKLKKGFRVKWRKIVIID